MRKPTHSVPAPGPFWRVPRQATRRCGPTDRLVRESLIYLSKQSERRNNGDLKPGKNASLCRSKRWRTGGDAPAVGTRQPPFAGLLLQGTLIGDDLTGDDIHIKTRSLVSSSSNLDVMASGFEAEWLRLRRKVANGSDAHVVDEQFRIVRR